MWFNDCRSAEIAKNMKKTILYNKMYLHNFQRNFMKILKYYVLEFKIIEIRTTSYIIILKS